MSGFLCAVFLYLINFSIFTVSFDCCAVNSYIKFTVAVVRRVKEASSL